MSFREDGEKKIRELGELSLPAYASNFFCTHSVDQIINLELGTEVKTAGRIMADRNLGVIRFLKIANIKGGIQVIGDQNTLGEHDKKVFSLINLWDIIGVEGIVGISKTGEKSIILHKVTVLSKARSQLGDKWHGVEDVETKLRKRYMDLLMDKKTRNTFNIRHSLLKNIRLYLYKEDFTEVETPILQNIPSGASANPFKTYYEALGKDFFLRIAPELFLKRLLVGGYEKVFEMGRCFRNEGIDQTHSPEFTMLELYQAYISYEDLQKFAINFLQKIILDTLGTLKTSKIDFSSVEFISYDDLFIKYGGLDIRNKTEEEIKEIAVKAGLDVKIYKTFDSLKDGIYKKLCLSKIINPVLVYDYPSTPLSYPNREKPGYNYQFQIIAGKFEIVRACLELIDSEIQNKNFEEQMALGLSTGEKDIVRKDEDFIHCLEHAMPPTGGLGLGIDRLIMLLNEEEVGIRDVILFPALKLK